MHPIFERLKERKIVQWALAYAAGAVALSPRRMAHSQGISPHEFHRDPHFGEHALREC
jgi:hypothetical protein